MWTYYEGTTLDKFLAQTRRRGREVVVMDESIKLDRRRSFSRAVRNIIYGLGDSDIPVVLEIDRGNHNNGYVLKGVWLQRKGMNVRDSLDENNRRPHEDYFERARPESVLMQYARRG